MLGQIWTNPGNWLKIELKNCLGLSINPAFIIIIFFRLALQRPDVKNIHYIYFIFTFMHQAGERFPADV